MNPDDYDIHIELSKIYTWYNIRFRFNDTRPVCVCPPGQWPEKYWTRIRK